jgi:hypothetical protein
VGLTALAVEFATVPRQMRRALLLTLALVSGALLWAPAAPAQDEVPPGGQPVPPGPPPAPDLVLSGRNVRMTRTGVVGIKLGCRTNAAPGEACIGSLTLRLAKAIVIEVPPPPNARPNTKPRKRTIAPFNFGVIDFTVVIGDVAQMRLRLSKRAQDLIRQQERVRVDLIADYNSRAGAQGRSRRNVRFYFPTKPES